MKKSRFRFKHDIVVSGSSDLKTCTGGAEQKAFEVGKQIAKNKCLLISGATTGIPYVASLGSREAGGLNVGFSPAASKKGHIKKYKLPFEPYDVIIYTGTDYTGRDVIMTKSAEAVIIISGRVGTMHEFITAFETGKIIGVLEGTGGAADEIKGFLKRMKKRSKAPIIYDTDPKKLVKALVREIEKNNDIINNKK